ncbi:MAG: enoyl-CoA hydratase/isomerase family protein, partial [Dehalococcoidia bacterium]|nr:enoyl-CoA hydratase/isomerase family protein [Dehalococcoidia bacterium]
MIRSEITGGIRVLTLARPEALNAFNTEQFERRAELMVEAADDPGTRVVVLTGEGR